LEIRYPSVRCVSEAPRRSYSTAGEQYFSEHALKIYGHELERQVATGFGGDWIAKPLPVAVRIQGSARRQVFWGYDSQGGS
jgi:hypothetical protein